jgi:hypothetical protein
MIDFIRTKSAATILVLVAAATPAAGQVGAIGGAPGGVIAGSGDLARSPIFTESAYTLAKSSWSASAFGGYTSGSFEDGVTTGTDFNFTQLLLGGFYAPSDRLTVGASLFAYSSVSVSNSFGSADESGHGDASLYGKYQVWNNGSTSIAGIASLGLPIGDDNFGAQGASFGLGGAISHNADRVSVHGSLGFTIPTDDTDGSTTTNFTGALMYAAQPKLTLGLELLGSTTKIDVIDERYTTIDLAPSARLSVGDRVFLDGGLIFNVSTSPGQSPYDYGFVFGATLTR